MIALSGALPASATLYTYSSGTLNYNLPDDGQLYSKTIDVTHPDSSITDVNVLLNFSGGYNADLYGYLLYDNKTVVLLNRIGITDSNPFGNSGAGMDVTLSDGGANGDIHLASSGVLNGTYEADGRAISPLSTGLQFDEASRQTLSYFNGSNPNGTWTLFLADMSGGEQSQLVSWSLVIDAVPEPITWALVIFGALAVFWKFVLPRLRRKLSALQPKPARALAPRSIPNERR